MTRIMPFVALAALLCISIPAAMAAQSFNQCVDAYFDMTDFIRTQAWGREWVTEPARRQEVLEVVTRQFVDFDRELQMAILDQPNRWTELQEDWARLDDGQKGELVGRWRTELLLPTSLCLSSAKRAPYISEMGFISAFFPADWRTTQLETGSNSLIAAGPAGSDADWGTITDASRCPDGALFIGGTRDGRMQDIESLVDGAKLGVRLFIAQRLPDFEQKLELDLGAAGLVVMQGQRPNEDDEFCFWMAAALLDERTYLVSVFGTHVATAPEVVPHLFEVLWSAEIIDQATGEARSMQTELLGVAMTNDAWTVEPQQNG
ncbi:MAG TPA: hypothetical protein DGT21_10865 [Armatimonadetes bacterium]|nr:hypothetical protein [Armatimonadota bacterium]